MKSAIVFILTSLIIIASSASQAQPGNAMMFIKGADGSVRTSPITGGNCTFDNVKPGPYAVGMLLPAVQKVREAAARSSNAPASASHDKWIEIESWSWGASNSNYGGGGSTGKVQFQDFHMTSVPPTRAQLTSKTVRNGQEYYEVKFKDILVSGIQSTSSPTSSGGDRPMESVSLNFTKITWNLKENKK